MRSKLGDLDNGSDCDITTICISGILSTVYILTSGNNIGGQLCTSLICIRE